MSKINYIIRPITNGMYDDTYTVYYSNGTRRRYTINGAMNKKHFEFIQSAIVESFYSKWTGAHKHDIFRPAPAEGPAADQTEEATQEDETMRFKKDYFAVTTKKVDKFNAIRFDSDIEFDVTNCTEDQEPAAIRKALEKFVDELKKHGGAEILVDSLEMSLRFDEIGPECTFNEIRNGGNAFEIEINRYDDKSMSIYLRICEHQDAPENEPAEEPAAVQTTEDQAAEVQAAEESKNYYAESYNFGFIAHNSEYGAPSLLIFSSKEDREKYINKYDIYRGNVNKRVIAITAKEARKYYERTRDGVRGWKDGTEYIKHIRDNIYYSVESGDYGRTSEEFTL